MRKKLIVLGFLCVLFFSCNGLFNSKHKETPTKEEPVYVPNIAWTLETNAFMTWTKGTQYKNYFYIPESNWYFKEKEEPVRQCLAKIDLNTGNYVWKTEEIEMEGYSYSLETTYALVINDVVYIYYKDHIMRCYSDIDGSLLASISFGNTKQEKRNHGATETRNILHYNGYFYWPNFVDYKASPFGLLRFDSSLIDFTKDPDEVQVILPELIWQDDRKQGILAEPVMSENGMLYFLTYNSTFNEGIGNSYLGAIDCTKENIENNAALLWMLPLRSKGLTSAPLVLDGDFIYIVDFYPTCVDVKKGKIIYEKYQKYSDYWKEVDISASPFLIGVFLHQGKLYYTGLDSCNTASHLGIPEQYVKNIFCLDAKTGKLLWADMPPNSSSLSTRPIVYNNYAYVVGYMCLRVYNAQTGELIGVDKNIYNLGKDPNALWDGKVIYFNYDKQKRKAILTAIYGD